MKKIKDLPANERPRGKLLSIGAKSLIPDIIYSNKIFNALPSAEMSEMILTKGELCLSIHI
ncbi:MAG: hypothetical protein H8E61_01035 [Bacteroidetes bacterium]|nr:hypothetical protein [Bacteroidota bacterium]